MGLIHNLSDLARPGYDDAWFLGATPEMRQTVLNCRYKMGDLWRFVAREDGSEPGKLHFRCTDVEALRAALQTSPSRLRADALRRGKPFRLSEKNGRWEASERTFGPSLHLKHFAGWDDDRVQAHVDPFGAYVRRRWWFTLVVPLIQLARHGLHLKGYLDVFDVARRLGDDGAPAWVGAGPSTSSKRP